MAVKEIGGRMIFYILVKGRKALMHIPVGFVNPCGRIMGDKNIHRRHLLHQASDLALFVKVVAGRLVAPAAVESTNPKALEGGRIEMHVTDGAAEGSRGIVVAFHGQNNLTAATLRSVEYDVLRNIAAGKQEISAPHGVIVLRDRQIGDNADIHGIPHGPVTDS
mgnify:CR=1 FL=1